MKTRTTKRRGFTLVELLVVIVIIASLAGLATPMILRQRKAADRTQAVSNAKQVGQVLIDFDSEFGSFPDNDTADLVKEATQTPLSLSGNSANDYFRQMLAYGTDSEKIFYAKASYTRPPDDDITQGNALVAGEVGFGYIMQDTSTAQSTASKGARPVLCAPLLDAQTNFTFDPDPYDKKAVILRIDNSADTLIIRETDNKATIGKGRTLEKTGSGTVWGTSINPSLKAPLPR